MEKWAMKVRLWGLAVRGSGINQPELRSPWNQSSEHRMSANEHDPTNLQVYTKPAALNFCFCRKSCDLRLGNARGRDQSLLENQHAISPSLHHSLEQSLVCRVLPERDVAPWPGLHLYHTGEPLAWTVCWVRVVLFALSMLSNSLGYSTQTQLHISTTQGALKTTRPIWSGLWGWPRWHQCVAGIGTTGKKCLLQTIYRGSLCTC